MKFNKYILTGIIIIILIGAGILSYYSFFKEKESHNFELDTLFLKISLKQGGSTTNTIQVTNTNHQTEYFSIQINQMTDFVNLNPLEFELSPGETKNIKLFFNSSDKKTGVYVGEVIFSSNGDSKFVPIILEIETPEVLFDSNLNLFPQTKSILPGQRLNAEVKIFDLNNPSIGRTNIELVYSLKGLDGRIIFEESDNVIVDGTLDYSRSIDLPKNLRLGSYVLYVVLKHENCTGTSSAFFEVVDQEQAISGGSDKTIIYVLFMFGFFFLIFLGLFIYSLFFRDKMLNEIKKQYQSELRRQTKMIEAQRQEDYARLKNPEEKREYKKEVEEIKRLRLSALRTARNKKISELHTIKKKFKGDNLKNQLAKWKKQGYDTSVLEKKYKLPNINEIRNKIKRWKKQGYDTSVLEKGVK